MKQDPYWFFKKWGFPEPLPADDIYDRLTQLEDRIKVLEEENIGLTNALYEMENALEARIDILTGELWLKKDV